MTIQHLGITHPDIKYITQHNFHAIESIMFLSWFNQPVVAEDCVAIFKIKNLMP